MDSGPGGITSRFRPANSLTLPREQSAEKSSEEIDNILVAGRLQFATQVFGVVNRQALIRRLRRAVERGMEADTPVAFFAHPIAGPAMIYGGPASPMSVTMAADEEDSPEVIEFEREEQEIDLEPLLKTNIAVLTYDTPLLTVYCTFQQQPDISIVIATQPRYHGSSKLAIICRDEFFSKHVIPPGPDSPGSKISSFRNLEVGGFVARTISLVSSGVDFVRSGTRDVLGTSSPSRRRMSGAFSQFDDIDGDPEVVRPSSPYATTVGKQNDLV